MRKGVKMERSKIHTLTYADDTISIAEKEKEMKRMVRKLERYLERN